MSDSEIDQDFTQGTSGASETFPIQCSALRKNGFVVMKNRPCKIVDMSTSKTGKHGSAKVHMVGIDIFTSKKYEDISPSTHNMEVPNVSRIEFTLCDVSDGYLSLMDQNGNIKDDVRLPEGEVGAAIQAALADGKETIVTVLKAMGEECAIQVKAS